MTIKAGCILIGALIASGQAISATELSIATVNNGHMIEMQRLSGFFEKENPDIKLKWVTLEEDVLRRRLSADIESGRGDFDVMTIGMYEAPIWAKREWLIEVRPDADYDINDILPPIRAGLSVGGKMYAAPFYGESSMVMYRDDLVAKTGLTILDRHTWARIRDVASRIHDPKNGIYGICLRGKPGWGDNMALIATIVNSHGGQFFDMNWKPQFNTKPWRDAVNLYIDLVKNFGPPDSESNSFNEILALFNKGKCGIWIDASIAASFITDPKQSKVASKIGFAQSPVEVTERGANWLWAWALAIPKSSKNVDAAQRFINWATSKQYIQLVSRESGWSSVPTGTRKSTYGSIGFRRISQFGSSELKAIYSADPKRSTLPPSPYVGVQFATIPEFAGIGTVAAQQIHAALVGTISVDEALEVTQRAADHEMRKAGYYK